MAPTKKAKHATAIVRKYMCTSVAYTCPTCRVTFFNSIFTDKVMRLRCECGQEIILDYPTDGQNGSNQS